MKKLILAVGLVLFSVSAFAGEILVNGGFETGVLSPWYTDHTDACFDTCVPWYVTTVSVHSGSYSATDVGNIDVRQDFAPIAASSITSITFWINNSAGLDAVYFWYSDFSIGWAFIFPPAGEWTFEDVTSALDTSKILSGISIFGCSPNCVTYLDDVSIQAGVPEPGTLAMLASGVLMLAGGLRRRM